VPRPLLPILLCAALGILLVEYAPCVGRFGLHASAVLLLVCSVLLIKRKGAGLRTVLILAAVVALAGANYYRLRWTRPSNDLARLAIKPWSRIKVFGKIAGNSTMRTFKRWDGYTAERSFVTMDVDQLEADGKRFSVNARVGLSHDGHDPELIRGDRVVVRGVYFPLRGATNPGQFDFGLKCAREGLSGSLYTRNPLHVTVLQKAPWWSAWSIVAAMRNRAQASLRAMLGESEQLTLARCLIIGDQTALDSAQRDRLAAAGVYHFFVVSGLHLAVVVAIFWLPLGLFGARERTQILTVVSVIIIYSMITGLRPPIVRAGLMALAACGAMLAGRKYDSLSAVCLAGILILTVKPAELFGAGFQLSFLAVFSLILITPILKDLLFAKEPDDPLEALLRRKKLARLRRMRPLYLLLIASVSVWLGLCPLLAYHFNIISFGSVIGNVLLIPFLYILLAAGLAGTLVTAVFSGLAPVFGFVLGKILFVVGALAEVLYKLDFLYFYVPDIGLAGFAGGYLIVVAVCLVLSRTLRKRYGIAAFAAGCLLVCAGVYRPPVSVPELTLLDVRAGLSTVVRLPGSRTVVFDTGTSSRMHVARAITAPALWSMGVRRLDELALSHNDMDHISGVPALVLRMRPKRIRVSPNFFDREIGEALLEKHIRRSSPEICSTGYLSAKGRDYTLRVIFPPRAMKFSTRNDGSLALELCGRSGRVIIFGDQKKEAVDWMADNLDLRCDVVVLPHHGRISPETLNKILDATGARTALISGTGPDVIRNTLTILDQRAIKWHATFRDGAIRLVMGKDSIEILTHGANPVPF